MQGVGALHAQSRITCEQVKADIYRNLPLNKHCFREWPGIDSYCGDEKHLAARASIVNYRTGNQGPGHPETGTLALLTTASTWFCPQVGHIIFIPTLAFPFHFGLSGRNTVWISRQRTAPTDDTPKATPVLEIIEQDTRPGEPSTDKTGALHLVTPAATEPIAAATSSARLPVAQQPF